TWWVLGGGRWGEHRHDRAQQSCEERRLIRISEDCRVVVRAEGADEARREDPARDPVVVSDIVVTGTRALPRPVVVVRRRDQAAAGDGPVDPDALADRPGRSAGREQRLVGQLTAFLARLEVLRRRLREA